MEIWAEHGQEHRERVDVKAKVPDVRVGELEQAAAIISSSTNSWLNQVRVKPTSQSMYEVRNEMNAFQWSSGVANRRSRVVECGSSIIVSARVILPPNGMPRGKVKEQTELSPLRRKIP